MPVLLLLVSLFVLGTSFGISEMRLTASLDPAKGLLSISGTTDALAGCLAAQRTPETRMRPTIERRLLARDCLTRADAALARIGNFSEAHLARAISLGVLGRPAEARHALAASRQAAPRLGWLAATRADVASDLLTEEPAARALLQEDLRLLARDPAYLSRLAYWHRVWSQPARDELHAALRDVPMSLQRRFLDLAATGSGT